MKPFEITQIVPREGEEGARVVINISEGLIGPVSKQLKATPGYRKGCGMLQKLGFVLEAIGNHVYNEDALPEELKSLAPSTEPVAEPG